VPNIDSQNPSVVSSGGAIGKQFNPDGAIGQIGEAVGGPFSKVRLPTSTSMPNPASTPLPTTPLPTTPRFGLYVLDVV